jgi:tetratricopeptide (TPR) repeat protein
MEALDAVEESEDWDLHVKAYRDLYISLGTVRQALEESDRAIRAFSSAARLSYFLEDTRGQAVALTWLGSVQTDTGRPELALRSFDAAERLAQSVDYAGWMGTIYFFRASAWQALVNFEEAEAAVHQAIQHHQTTAGANSPDEVGCVMKLGRIALEKGDLEETIACYQQALGILREVGVSQMHRIIYLRLGEAYWYQGEFSQAYEMLRQALDVYESKRQTVSELWARVDFAPSRDLVYEYLVRTCLALGKVVEAFTAVEEGRMRVFREQLAVQPITDEPVETLGWSNIKLLLCLES